MPKMDGPDLPPSYKQAAIEHPMIFFDGVCGMCNRFVDVILHADSEGLFRFAPLQGETARQVLTELPPHPEEWSVIYLDEHGIHGQSDASLEIYRRLGGGWWLLSLARFVPRSVRDPIYRIIARHRYRWFGRSNSCRVPNEREKERFLP